MRQLEISREELVDGSALRDRIELYVGSGEDADEILAEIEDSAGDERVAGWRILPSAGQAGWDVAPRREPA